MKAPLHVFLIQCFSLWRQRQVVVKKRMISRSRDIEKWRVPKSLNVLHREWSVFPGTNEPSPVWGCSCPRASVEKERWVILCDEPISRCDRGMEAGAGRPASIPFSAQHGMERRLDGRGKHLVIQVRPTQQLKADGFIYETRGRKLRTLLLLPRMIACHQCRLHPPFA